MNENCLVDPGLHCITSRMTTYYHSGRGLSEGTESIERNICSCFWVPAFAGMTRGGGEDDKIVIA